MRSVVANNINDWKKEEELGEEESNHLLFMSKNIRTIKQRYPTLLLCRSKGDRKRWIAYPSRRMTIMEIHRSNRMLNTSMTIE